MDPIYRIDLPPLTHGPGAIEECGMIACSLGLTRVLLMTDRRLKNHAAVTSTMDSLTGAGIEVAIYPDVRVEPTDRSIEAATQAADQAKVDGFVSVGGGSVIDTTKATNLYNSYPAPLLTYVNAPIGQARLVPGPLKPHIAIPTTCGTGSEVTGIAVFDFLQMRAKTGIMSRRMVPSHAIVDPTALESLPPLILAATALDALCHAMEAYTSNRSNLRDLPKSPDHRPMTQGANEWTDFIALQAIKIFAGSFDQAVSGEIEARARLLWASTLAGNAFGNSGCHVPHALSYPVSGMVEDYYPEGYPDDEPMVPHGVSVVLNAPSTYRLTGPKAPERHVRLAELLNVNVTGLPPSRAGDALAQRLIEFMKRSGFPSGLREIGYSEQHLERLIAGAMPQRRLLNNAPIDINATAVKKLYIDAMSYW